MGAEGYAGEAPAAVVPPTPIVVVATSPFTIIGFNEDDRLDATFEQVNHNSYDYVKFCRTTMALDAEFENPIPAVLSYTSCFIFPAVHGATKQTCVDATNRILFRLFFAGILFDAAKPNDVGRGYLNHTGYFRFTEGGAGESASFISALQNRMTGQDRNIRLLTPRFFTKSEITNAYWLGRRNTTKVAPISQSLFMNSISTFQSHEYEFHLSYLHGRLLSSSSI